MSSQQNHCLNQGRLVDAYSPVPENRFDFVWGHTTATFGCSHLCCDKTGEPVKNRRGYEASNGLTPDIIGELYRCDDWSRFEAAGLVEKCNYNRLYLSPVQFRNVHLNRFIFDERLDELGPSIPWRCGGHPCLELPSEIDGEQISENTDWQTLLMGLLGGERARSRPAYKEQHPFAWAERLYHLVKHTPLAGALSRSVAGCLEATELEVLGAGLHFFCYLPHAPGGERLAELVLDGGERLRGSVPSRPHVTLESLLFSSLSSRLEGTAGPGDEPLLEAARTAAVWTSKTNYRLVEALALRDPQWLSGQAQAIYEVNPTTLTLDALFKGLYPHLQNDLGALVSALYEKELVERTYFINSVKTQIPDPLKSEILDALPS